MAKAKKPEPTAEEQPVELDAGSALYRDRSGTKLGGGPSEGTLYKGVVAENAIASVTAHEAKAEE